MRPKLQIRIFLNGKIHPCLLYVQVITSVPDMNAEDVSLAVDAAQDAFQVQWLGVFLSYLAFNIYLKYYDI